MSLLNNEIAENIKILIQEARSKMADMEYKNLSNKEFWFKRDNIFERIKKDKRLCAVINGKHVLLSNGLLFLVSELEKGEAQ